MRFPPRNAKDFNRSRIGRRTSPRGGSVVELYGAGLIGRVTRQGGLVAHYDARDIEASEGDLVSLWPDRTGAHDLSSAADANRPSYTAGSWASGPAVEFSGVTGLRSLYSSGIASDAVSAVAICTSGAAATGTALEYTGNVYNNRGFALLTNAGKRRAELGADVARSYAEGGDVITDQAVAIAMVGTRATSPDTCNVWSETGEITPSASGTVDGGGDHEAAYLYIGSRLATGTNQLDGMIRSIVIVESALDDAAMQTLIDGMVASAGGLTLTQGGGGGAAMTEYNLDDIAGTTITDSGVVVFDSGGSAGDYSNGEDYTVTFQAAPGQTVTATITDCEIENYYQEGLQFYDDGAAIGGRIYGSATGSTGFWSGQSTPYDVTTATNVMQVNFKSDFSVTAAGFRMEVTFS